MENIYIKNIIVNENKVDVYFKISQGISKYFAKQLHFFVEYSTDVSNVPKSILVIPILTNILQFSWLADALVWVEEIDEDFYNTIPRLKSAFRELHPNIDIRGTLIAAKQIKNSFDSKGNIIQLFTGGIDATTTMIRIMDKRPILFNTNGWYYQEPSELNQVYDADYKAITNIANNYNLNAEFVKSNFATFIKSEMVDKDFCRPAGTTWWFGFQHSVAFIGCAMVLGYIYIMLIVYTLRVHILLGKILFACPIRVLTVAFNVPE